MLSPGTTCHQRSGLGALGWSGRVCVANLDLFPAAQMGVGEGKSIGQWYGPNTVAQVLKYVLNFRCRARGSRDVPWGLNSP